MGSINLHRDLDQKRFSFLFYLGFSDGIKRDYGGTQFYKYNGKPSYLVDHYIHLKEDFDIIKDVHPYPNRLACFMRTNNSWHGVKEISFEDNNQIVRDNLQFNYMKCDVSNWIAF